MKIIGIKKVKILLLGTILILAREEFVFSQGIVATGAKIIQTEQLGGYKMDSGLWVPKRLGKWNLFPADTIGFMYFNPVSKFYYGMGQGYDRFLQLGDTTLLKTIISSGGSVDSSVYTTHTYNSRFPMRIFNLVSDFGPVDNTGVLDATVQFQNAINAVLAFGAGILNVPFGIYRINKTDSLSTARDCLVTIPQRNFADKGRGTIIIQGESAPSTSAQSYTTNTRPTHNGSIIYSSAAGVDSNSCIIGDGNLAGFSDFTKLNGNDVRIYNLTFMDSAYLPSGPRLGGINLYNIQSADIDNVLVTVDTSVVDSNNFAKNYATHGVTGIIAPAFNVASQFNITNSTVQGFDNGFRFSEVGVANNIFAFGCKNAFTFDKGIHDNYLGFVGAYSCQTAVRVLYTSDVNNTSDINIEMLDVEANTFSAFRWYNNIWTVWDSLSKGRGKIKYLISGNGINTGALLLNGAKFINFEKYNGGLNFSDATNTSRLIGSGGAVGDIDSNKDATGESFWARKVTSGALSGEVFGPGSSLNFLNSAIISTTPGITNGIRLGTFGPNPLFFSTGMIQGYDSTRGEVFGSGHWYIGGSPIDNGFGLEVSGSVKVGTSLNIGIAIVFSGTGSPESVITAHIGSLYLRTDGGANTTLYVKESGTGNTGWIAK